MLNDDRLLTPRLLEDGWLHGLNEPPFVPTIVGAWVGGLVYSPVAAVIFLPPTLVGTIYGMNFEHMPELGWAYGYPFALLMMLLSAILPYLWFKQKGWL